MGELDKLTDIDLSGNLFKTLPAAVLDMKNLERLDIMRNQLTDIPDGVEKLKNLQWLRLDGNNISRDRRVEIKALLPDCHVVF
jgi:Leucine-rich repeat (LRR) protein